jgi:hypothetical protein
MPTASYANAAPTVASQQAAASKPIRIGVVEREDMAVPSRK